MKEKKNKIIITKNREDYSLHYGLEKSSANPKIIINKRGFYDIIFGILEMPKEIYKEGINKIYFKENDFDEFSKKEKKIFKGLIKILEKFTIENKDSEYKTK